MNNISNSPLRAQAPQAPATPVDASVAPATSYEAPAIESSFSTDDLQREVLYAGTPVSFDGPPVILGP